MQQNMVYKLFHIYFINSILPNISQVKELIKKNEADKTAGLIMHI